MKVIAKKNRELALINAQNTQNENRAEIITLVVPEEYEDYNKKIVFITDDETVWDIITNNEYKITNAITKYKQVDFYIWLTKEVDGESIDFRTKTKTLNFYHNVDASDEITDEEIHGVNTVVNLLEEEIEKVENLNIEATKIGSTTTITITKKDGTTESVGINDGVDGQDGYTPQKGVDYFTEHDIEEIEGDILNEVYTKEQTDTLLQEKADVEDIPDVSNFITKDVNNLTNYTLKTNTGSLIDLEINDTTYVVTLKLKNQDGTIISTDTIDLPLETMVVNATYDNVNKAIILTLQNGTTVSISVADLVSGLVSESQLQTILSNYYTKIEINNLLNNKVDKVQGKELSSNDFTDTLKEKLEGLENYDDTEIKADISDIQDEQVEQNTDIAKLQTENARLKATLPTTTGEGQDITLNKTAELEFIKPPLPMGNSEQESTTGKNLINTSNCVGGSLNGDGIHLDAGYSYFNITDNKVTVTTTQMYRGFVSDYIECKPNTRYKLSYKTEQTGLSFENYYSFYDENKANGTRNQTGLSTAGAKYMRVSGTLSTATTADFYNIQLEEGSTATSYEPYTNGASPNPDYPQEITNVTGDVEVVVENKNLFNKNTVEDGKYINNVGEIREYHTYALSDYIPVKPSTKYTYQGISGFSERLGFYDKNKNLISVDSVSTLPQYQTLTTPSNCYYFRTTVLKVDIDKYQFEENSTATPYIAHQEQTFTFPLGNEKLMLGDYLADDGIHHVRKQIVLDGVDENWWLQNESAGQFGIIINGMTNNPILCTHFKYKLSYSSSGKPYLRPSNNTLYAEIGTEMLPEVSVNALKLWLQSNPITVEYELQEEVIVPYTSAQQEVYNQIKQALSYEEQTNISSNQNALFSVEAYQSTKLVLKEMATAIVALGGV